MDRVSDGRVYSHLLCILVAEYQGNAVVPPSVATDSFRSDVYAYLPYHMYFNRMACLTSPLFGLNANGEA